MGDKKLTKKDYYAMIKEVIADSEIDNGVELINFVDNQIALLDKKAAKAKEKAAEKRAEGDELRQAVKEVLTNDFQSVDDILNQIEMEDISKAKVIARLTALVKNGEAMKEKAKTEDKKEITIYSLVHEIAE